MSYHFIIAAAVLSAVGTATFAQGVAGGQLGVEYNAPTDGSDFGGTTYTGGLEYAVTRQISVAVDATGYNTDSLTISGTNITLHGIYHLNGSASAGLFYGRDSLDGETDDADVYGVEGGTGFQGAAFSGYLGRADDGTDKATLFGANGAYALQSGFSVIGDLDVLRSGSDDLTVSRFSVGGQYEIQNGPQLYGEVGTVRFSADNTTEDQTFIGFGARVAFGTDRGTTFDSRSGFNAVAGF